MKSYVLFSVRHNGYLTTGATYALSHNSHMCPNPLWAHQYRTAEDAEKVGKRILDVANDPRNSLEVHEISNPTVETVLNVGHPVAKQGYVIEIIPKKLSSGLYDWNRREFFKAFPYSWDDPKGGYSRWINQTFTNGRKPKIWATESGANATLVRLQERAANPAKDDNGEYTFRIVPYVRNMEQERRQ